MKKTLIALAVATFGVVSGSATAWTEKGTGNPVEPRQPGGCKSGCGRI